MEGRKLVCNAQSTMTVISGQITKGNKNQNQIYIILKQKSNKTDAYIHNMYQVQVLGLVKILILSLKKGTGYMRNRLQYMYTLAGVQSHLHYKLYKLQCTPTT